MEKYAGYRWFIDELVEIASRDVVASRIRENGHGARTNESDGLPLSPEEKEEKEILLSLDPHARSVVARMIETARRSAIHDLASFLDGEIFGGKVSISVGNEKLTESPYASYHYDFTCRLEGDSWPNLE